VSRPRPRRSPVAAPAPVPSGTTPFEGVRLLLLLVAVVAVLAGPAYAVNGATQAPLGPAVPVLLPAGAGEQELAAVAASVADAGGWLRPPTADDQGGVAQDRLVVSDLGAGRLERLLERADTAALGLGVAVGALVLRSLLLTVALGRRWGRHEARLLVLAAVAAVGAGMVGPSLALGARQATLDRLGAAGEGLALHPADAGPGLVVLIGVLLLLAAAARRSGTVDGSVDGDVPVAQPPSTDR